ncbi:Purkinje cell protein 2 homolog [Anomaloglossus baeobatrachus]|uniref:Purkinje cell protein 2 homolog n=1 Tax=Anomaloglossus baeobatrachus TaxID=238106 RepID=UPI003F4F486C
MEPVDGGPEEEQARKPSLTPSETESLPEATKEQEGFFNLLSHVQGGRIDEQRCSIQIVHTSKADQDGKNTTVAPPPEMNHLMDMLAHSQSRRLDDQRAELIQSPSYPDTMPSRRVSHDNGGLKMDYINAANHQATRITIMLTLKVARSVFRVSIDSISAAVMMSRTCSRVLFRSL